MAEKDSLKSKWKLAGAVIWLVLTLSMASWWFYLGLNFLHQLEIHSISLHETIVRQKNMLIWEGLAWMVLLFTGGGTLIYLIARERVQSQKLRQFLASFSHDVKTALTSLRLQTDILKEEAGSLPVIARLETDVVRLELQLENSLFLAGREDYQFFLENLSLQRLIDSLKEHWPQLHIELTQDAVIKADRRAMDSVFRNLLQNAHVHGRAKKVFIRVKRIDAQQMEIQLSDDGKGFKGDVSLLGRLFERHHSSSGSGVGLFSVVELIQRMGGSVQFPSSLASGLGGFCVVIILPGGLP